MSDTSCTYHGRRDEILVAYLYDDLDPVERAEFDLHTAGCAVCRAELVELRTVRADLARWTPPAPARAFTFPPPVPRSRARLWTALGDIPVWAQVAAALLVLGVSAGIANVEVRYEREGFSLRTGWMSEPVASEQAAPPSAVGPTFRSGVTPELKLGPTGGQGADAAAAWRVDLVALEQRLRTDFQNTAGPRAGSSDAEVLRRVRALIEESEVRQRRELALGVARVSQQAQAQRVADLQRIQYSLGVLENTTGAAMMRQGRLINNIAVKVSQQQ
jgi:anti-sigma factor RsiW